jgi:putative oxidoreductase
MNDLDSINLGLLLLRVGAGITMFLHGYFHFFAGGRIAGTGRWFDSIGMKPGRMHALLASTTELVVGAMLAFGFLTTFAAAGYVGLLFVAAWTVHRYNGYRSVKDGWEYVSVLALLAVGVAVIGPGEWSIDDALGIAEDLNGLVGLIISVGGGLAAAIGLLAVYYRPPARTES